MSYLLSFLLAYAGIVLLAFGNGWGFLALFAALLVNGAQRIEDYLSENFPEGES